MTERYGPLSDADMMEHLFSRHGLMMGDAVRREMEIKPTEIMDTLRVLHRQMHAMKMSSHIHLEPVAGSDIA